MSISACFSIVKTDEAPTPADVVYEKLPHAFSTFVMERTGTLS